MLVIQRKLLRGLDGPHPTVADVCAVLQSALALEHATIPVYLYALYSLVPGKNREIAAIIESVATEEMLHMTLVANVINALGGTPEINRPGFVPTFPGPLPGGVESSLVVNLAPFSMTQLDAFLTIEEPEDPLQFKMRATFAAAPAAQVTIGQFYQVIIAALGRLPEGAFVQPPRNQVGPALFKEAIVVDDVTSAQQALTTIVEQGEGTSTSPEEDVGKGVAHYYRFLQIKKGYALVPSGATFAYAGPPIAFDPAGVYDLPSNPTAAMYAGQPAQLFAFDNFNYTYTSLLNALQQLFLGQSSAPDFRIAVGLMMSLKLQAGVMAEGIAYTSIPTGPSFQYQATNPAQPVLAANLS